MLRSSRFWILAFLAVYIPALFLTYGDASEWLSLPGPVLTGLRWAGVIALCVYAGLRGSLTTWILVSMVIGGEVGYDFPEIGGHLNVISKVFLKLIKTIIAPLLFGTLVVGIAGHSNLKQVGRMGWKSLLYFEVVTTIALFIGLGAINLTRAGDGIPREEPPPPVAVTADSLRTIVNIEKGTYQFSYQDQKLSAAPAAPKQNWEEIILHIFPENIAKAVFEGQILQIVVFSILFGIGLAMVQHQAQKQHMLHFAESLSEVMFKFTQVVMYFAPLAVGAALAYTVSEKGLIVLVNLGKLLLTLYGALIAFVLLVFVPIALAIRLPIRRFIQALAEPVSLAFATTSSEAALPKAMKAMEELGVPRKIVAFVMPTGYSFNLDGTTLYLSLATIFVAQAAGIHLDLGQQLLIVFTLMLTSKGVAGVPRASLVILSATAVSFDLPEWPIFVILGIDELMDMARTSVNVIGNCLATAVVARWEGEFHPEGEAPEV
ncbi:MAG: cation:dicarboxylase symporter family transporter [Bacteroidia bacterium]|nr:cation:dicarboxylase symporter family transporter [Bacteroidia bacterium]